jgi:hypothetical protein
LVNRYGISGNRKIFEAMTSTAPLGAIDSEASMFVANLYHGKYHWKYKLWKTKLQENAPRSCPTRDKISDIFCDSHMHIAGHSNRRLWMIHINNIWGIL